jgi:hypothetical protein
MSLSLFGECQTASFRNLVGAGHFKLHGQFGSLIVTS